MQLSGEVYQYAVIPRGIAACNRNFTFYQKKRLEPNPGKPRQITSYQKNYYRILIFFSWFLNYPMATSPNNTLIFSFHLITSIYFIRQNIQILQQFYYSLPSSLEMSFSLSSSDTCHDMRTPHQIIAGLL